MSIALFIDKNRLLTASTLNNFFHNFNVPENNLEFVEYAGILQTKTHPY